MATSIDDIDTYIYIYSDFAKNVCLYANNPFCFNFLSTPFIYFWLSFYVENPSHPHFPSYSTTATFSLMRCIVYKYFNLHKSYSYMMSRPKVNWYVVRSVCNSTCWCMYINLQKHLTRSHYVWVLQTHIVTVFKCMQYYTKSELCIITSLFVVHLRKKTASCGRSLAARKKCFIFNSHSNISYSTTL